MEVGVTEVLLVCGRGWSGRAAGRVAVCVLCVAMLGRAGVARAQDKPLPEKDAFLAEARKRITSDERLLSQYTFRERQVRTDFAGDGRAEKKTTKEFEVYPSVEGSPAYRRLIATNGVPEAPRKLEEADRKHREKLLEWIHDRQAESPSVRGRRELKERRGREQEERIMDDILRVYDIRLVGREEVRGRPAIVLTLTPRPGVKPSVEDAAPMTKLRGRAWVDERDFEVVRVGLESTDTINLGWGLLARIGSGTTLLFERQKVNDEVWLPARVTAHPKARIALVKRFDAEIISDYSDYRKFTVDTAISFAPAKPVK